MPDSAPPERLVPQGDHDTVVFTGDLTRQRGESSRFLECVFDTADLTDARMPRSRFTDCTLTAVRGAGTDLSQSEWLDTQW